MNIATTAIQDKPAVNLTPAEDARLIQNAYEAIACVGKRPIATGWTTGEITVDRLANERALYPNAVSTGLRTGALVGIDIDVVKWEHATKLRGLVQSILGVTPLRRKGAKGLMLLYRNETPISKIIIGSERPDEAKVEILGTGQQLIVFGIHPDTGKRYNWADGDKATPLTVPFNTLPLVTSDQLRKLAVAIAAELTNMGYGTAKVTGDIGEKPAALKDRVGEPVAGRVLRAALSHLDPNMERDEWRNIIAGIRAAPLVEDEHGDQARTLALEWSRGELDRFGRYEIETPKLYSTDDDVLAVFDTMPPKEDGIKVGSVFEAAKANGWNGNPFSDGKTAMEAFDAALSANTSEPNDAPGEAFELFEPHQFKDRPAPNWIVDGLVMEKRTHTLFGKSESMKTFQTLDLLASIAFGIPAFGKYEVFAPGDVVFFCDEDPDDLMKVRWPAWCKARGVNDPFANPTPGPGRFAVIPRCPLIMNPNDIPGAIKCIRDRKLRPKVIAIDTWAKAMVGMNQDSATDTGLLFQAMGELRREFGCATWLTHHPKKAEPTEMRGSGAQTNDGDVVWLASRTGDTLAVQWTNMKMKSAPRPAPLHFKGTLHAVDGLLDQHGRAITAPVFDAVDAPANIVRVDNSMTEKDVRKAEEKRANTRLRTGILSIIQRSDLFERDKSLTTKLMGQSLYTLFEGPRPQDEKAGVLWDDECQKITERLKYRSKDEKNSPLAGLFKLCKMGDGHMKKWFLQPSAQAEFDDLVASATMIQPGDEPIIEGPDLSPDTHSRPNHSAIGPTNVRC